MRADMRLLLANYGAPVPPADAKHIRTNPVYRGDTPNANDAQFFEAIKRNDIPTVQALLAHREDFYTTNKDGSSALNLAAYYGHHEVLQLFAEAGADLSDSRSTNHWTPLIAAIENPETVPGRVQTVRFLLEHGSLITAADARAILARLKANNAAELGEVEALLKQHTMPEVPAGTTRCFVPTKTRI
jgi:ankyrin repeat protein